MAERRRREPRGFLKGLQDFIRLLEDMQKKGELGRTVSGEVEGPGYSRVSYDYSVKLGIGKEDFPLPTGRGFKPRPVRRVRFSKHNLKPREPLVDVFDKGGHVLVVAELPNVREEDLTIKAVGNVLKINAKTPGGRLKREIELPESREYEVLEASLKNGVLEIDLRKKGGDSHGEQGDEQSG